MLAEQRRDRTRPTGNARCAPRPLVGDTTPGDGTPAGGAAGSAAASGGAGEAAPAGGLVLPEAAGLPAAQVAELVTAVRHWLDGFDGQVGDDPGRVEMIAATERLKRSLAAVQARVTVAFADSQTAAGIAAGLSPVVAAATVGPQVGLARREAPQCGARQVATARALTSCLPATMAALSAGLIGERHVQAVIRASIHLGDADRAVIDARIGADLPGMSVPALEAAVTALADDLDPAAAVARREVAVKARSVWTKPHPGGSAAQGISGPLERVIGAYASVRAAALAILHGRDQDEPADGRTLGQIMSDLALARLSGTATRAAAPVALTLVMGATSVFGDPESPTDAPCPCTRPTSPADTGADTGADAQDDTQDDTLADALADTPPVDQGDDSLVPETQPGQAGGHDPGRCQPIGPLHPDGTITTPARIVGWGPIPAWLGRKLLRDGIDEPTRQAAHVTLRRVFTSPDHSDLIALESTARLFPAKLRALLVLRDHHCRTPWCEAGIAHADHITPHRAGGRTRYHNGQGLSERCNYLKDLPGFTTRRLTRAEIRDRAATDPDFATRIGAHTHIT